MISACPELQTQLVFAREKHREEETQPFFVYFLAVCVLAIPLLKSHILVFLRDVWIRTPRAAVASGRATNLATHLPDNLATHLPDNFATHLPDNLATHLSIVCLEAKRKGTAFHFGGFFTVRQITFHRAGFRNRIRIRNRIRMDPH